MSNVDFFDADLIHSELGYAINMLKKLIVTDFCWKRNKNEK